MLAEATSEREAVRGLSREAVAARNLIQSLRSVGGEEDADLLADMVEGETGLFELLDVLLARIIETEGLREGVSVAIDNLNARERRFGERVNTLRALIEQALATAEIEAKVERPLATLSMAKRQPKAEIATEADIPAEFWKPAAPTLDKKALLAALKEGRTIPGAFLSNAAPTLTLRVK